MCFYMPFKHQATLLFYRDRPGGNWRRRRRESLDPIAFIELAIAISLPPLFPQKLVSSLSAFVYTNPKQSLFCPFIQKNLTPLPCIFLGGFSYKISTTYSLLLIYYSFYVTVLEYKGIIGLSTDKIIRLTLRLFRNTAPKTTLFWTLCNEKRGAG